MIGKIFSKDREIEKKSRTNEPILTIMTQSNEYIVRRKGLPKP